MAYQLQRCSSCNAQLIDARDWQTDKQIMLDFLPSSAGAYVLTDQGYCGELTEDELHALVRERAHALLFTRHDCRRSAPYWP